MEVFPTNNTYKIKWADGKLFNKFLNASDIRLKAADSAKLTKEELIKSSATQQQAAQAAQAAQAKADEDARNAKAVEDARLAKVAEEKKKKDAEQFAKFEATRKVKEAEEKKKLEENARLAREKQQKLNEEAAAREKHHISQLSSPSVGLYTYRTENNPGKLARSSSLHLYSNNGFGNKCNLSKAMQSPSIGMYTHFSSDSNATNFGGKSIETHK
jgi:hypothetical protein